MLIVAAALGLGNMVGDIRLGRGTAVRTRVRLGVATITILGLLAFLGTAVTGPGSALSSCSPAASSTRSALALCRRVGGPARTLRWSHPCAMDDSGGIKDEQTANERRAPRLGEKTGTHHSEADGDEAEGDEEATCVVTIAVGSSATAVVVDRAAAG